jgi:hypothetical protein
LPLVPGQTGGAGLTSSSAICRAPYLRWDVQVAQPVAAPPADDKAPVRWPC